MDIQNLISHKIFTVSEFNDFINDILTPLSMTVEGEVSEWKIAKGNLIWFTLKDEKQTLNCFSLTHRIRLPVETGMRVKIHGRPKVFGKSGRFVFDVEYLELSGEGSIQKAFLLLKTKLEKEGLFAPERKRPLPRFPQSIGLVTSAGAAAYTDFLKQLNLRFGGLKIVFIPVAVQGKSAVREVVAAFDRFNQPGNRPDVIVLTRGGGSLEDLQYFNSEEIVRAVFASASPVVCAIGHERDVSLCELAADLRAATPTQAAHLVVPNRAELLSELNRFDLALARVTDALFQREKHRLAMLAHELSSRIAGKTGRALMLLEKFRLNFQQLTGRVKFLKQRAEGLKKLLFSLAPENILARGYSIVKKSGKIVKDASQIKIGENLDITLAKGLIEAEVKKITNA